MLWQARRGFISGNYAAMGAFVSAQAAAFLARTSGLDTTHANAYVGLINGLVSDGIWTKLDALWIPATQDSTTAKLNLTSSSFGLTPTGSPTWTADRGYTGVSASTTVFVNTSFSPSTNGVQATRNSTHVSAWSVANIAADNASIMGTSDGTNLTFIKPKDIINSNGNVTEVNSSGAAVIVTNTDSSGHYIANRSTNTAVQSYRNGSSNGSGSIASTVPPTTNIYLCAINNNGPAVGSPYQVAAASIGASLAGGSDAVNFYNRLRTYMTAVGVP